MTAVEFKTIHLWEKGAPGTPATKPQDEPELYMKLPTVPSNGTAVIILPGGGYGGLAMTYEGLDVGDWFASFGVTAFVLKYRMHGTGHMHPVPMMDGQRAIRTVRARAAEWKIDPSRIGVLGFSAGGHLASTLGTHFDKGDAKSDRSDRTRQLAARFFDPVLPRYFVYGRNGSPRLDHELARRKARSETAAKPVQ